MGRNWGKELAVALVRWPILFQRIVPDRLPKTVDPAVCGRPGHALPARPGIYRVQTCCLGLLFSGVRDRALGISWKSPTSPRPPDVTAEGVKDVRTHFIKSPDEV